MKSNRIYFVKKYALVLVCFYLLETIGSRGLTTYMETIEFSDHQNIYLNVIAYSGVFYLASIVLAIMVYTDIRKTDIEAKYAVLCTVIFAPMGVCLFLLYAILADVNQIASRDRSANF